MRKLYALSMVGCLLVGIFIGYNTDNIPLELNTEVEAMSNTEYSSQVEFYDDMIKDIDTVQVYDASDMTLEILQNRDGKIIIEKVICKVTTDNLDGEVMNIGKNMHNYISYKRVEGAKKGDVVLTYFVYNPFTNAEDDVIIRTDFIIDGYII